jgi:branched-chain amino acid transport system ATP-binding protein
MNDGGRSPGAGAGGPAALLRTAGVGKDFGGFTAVRNVDLRVAAGEVRAIIGPNGAGKTTLFNLISGELTPSRGRIFYRGADVTRAPSYELARRGIGRSFQVTNVFRRLSVLENVRIAVQARFGARYDFFTSVGRRPEVRERAEEILRTIGLADDRHREAGVLSHGDQRRLEIGIVLATDPELVLLDEPTSGMSREETHATLELIQRVAARKTIVFIEHNMDVVMHAARVITVMHRGDVIAEGGPAEIRAHDEVRRAYLGGTDAPSRSP